MLGLNRGLSKAKGIFHHWAACTPAPRRLLSHFISSTLEQGFDAKLKNAGDNKNVLKEKNRCRGLEGRPWGLEGSLSRRHSESLRKQSLGSRSWYPRMNLQKCLVGLLLSLTVWRMTWPISLLSLQSFPPECKASYNGFSFLEWREALSLPWVQDKAGTKTVAGFHNTIDAPLYLLCCEKWGCGAWTNRLHTWQKKKVDFMLLGACVQPWQLTTRLWSPAVTWAAAHCSFFFFFLSLFFFFFLGISPAHWWACLPRANVYV